MKAECVEPFPDISGHHDGFTGGFREEIGRISVFPVGTPCHKTAASKPHKTSLPDRKLAEKDNVTKVKCGN